MCTSAPLAYKSSDVVGLRIHDFEASPNLHVPFGNYSIPTAGSLHLLNWTRIRTRIPPSAKVTGCRRNSLRKERSGLTWLREATS